MCRQLKQVTTGSLTIQHSFLQSCAVIRPFSFLPTANHVLAQLVILDLDRVRSSFLGDGRYLLSATIGNCRKVEQVRQDEGAETITLEKEAKKSEKVGGWRWLATSGAEATGSGQSVGGHRRQNRRGVTRRSGVIGVWFGFFSSLFASPVLASLQFSAPPPQYPPLFCSNAGNNRVP